MKSWKVVTLCSFLCLNIIFCYITFSLVNRSSTSVGHNQHRDRDGSSGENLLSASRHPVVDIDLVRETPGSHVAPRSPGSVTEWPTNDRFPIYRRSYSSKKEKLDQLTLMSLTLKPAEGLCTSNTKILIAVCSSFDHFERREAIRSTWGNQTFIKHMNMAIAFIIALPQPQVQHLQTYLLQEHITYGDIVQLNHTDHYKNLSLKSLGMLYWTMNHCNDARFLLKTDDDIFLNVPNLVHLLNESDYVERENFIFGSIIQAAQPVRNRMSKWFTPTSVYRGDSYPAYTSGTAYLISRDVVFKLCSKSESHPIFWLEDIFLTGILAKQLDVELIHDSRFHYKKTKKRRDPCWYKTVLTVHDQSPQDLMRIWEYASLNGEMNDLQWVSCQNITEQTVINQRSYIVQLRNKT